MNMGGASKIPMLLSSPFPLLYLRPSTYSAVALHLLCHRRPVSSLSSASFPHSAPLLRPRLPFKSQLHAHAHPNNSNTPPALISRGILWPEWTKLVENLTAGGYSARGASAAATGGAGYDEDAVTVEDESLPEEFTRAAEACLAFARERPDAFRLLSKKNVEVIVDSGLPTLFKNGEISARRLKLFLSGHESSVLDSARAQTVDVMRYVLSYAYDLLSIPEGINHKDVEHLQTSVRSLLTELVNMSEPVQAPGSKFTDSIPRQAPISYEQFSRPPGKIIEMKRGDWICPKCNFMNFARNARCLECEEARPKRQLSGGEWECPQCDFFNNGRNMSCLRCDCKRPVEITASSPYGKISSVDQILSEGTNNESELYHRLAASDGKAERWFSNVSQVGDKDDMSSAIPGQDFPEIKPLRKGANKFVVSTRKTPLERRLANSHSGSVSESSINQSLDRILGRSSNPPTTGEANSGTVRSDTSDYRKSIAKADPSYVPFVPLPPDMFSKPQKSNNQVQHKEDGASIKADTFSESPTWSSTNSAESKNISDLSDVSERLSKKVEELGNVTDLTSTAPDEDFPEIMPLRKGENRFVVSKKKDRSLTSPQYKRRLAMEQASESDFVPFVPFPPDYFAKKDKQPKVTPANNEAGTQGTAQPAKVQAVPDKLENHMGAPNWASMGSTSNQPENRNYNNQSYNSQFSGSDWNETRVGYGKESSPSGTSQMSSAPISTGAMSNAPTRASSNWGPAQETGKSLSTGQSWNKAFSGKSLEGSAVTEPDPLDMSEEAKAARWFRRAAQIKNISELSEIPDEDFPEIMPMRKGVNRFVVSKRKTPLERRLTSPQYRRNLPIVSSEPEKDASGDH